ncbi:SRPBCC domain-containing protein [Mycobacterium sp. SMC-4]|uniref:SRPBCC family protein n=1 Tax=Mycobacterium sp. SMC-4 TaxID=2857059 RepID=UPI0021B1A724|nr:SRPBCC domain-containing protein [Mycobacterium sp. SMC-4]UXA18450.1 SRPBCC domain-containing protein [Mycobacterium sp. SMC-4]
MALKKDGDGRRWVEMEFPVPGTPEQVWQAIATGPGMTAWFTHTAVDEKVGGAVEFDFGDGSASTGIVTCWQPPERFCYEEHGWSGDAPPVATEVVVISRTGDRCVVRMVHSLFTDRDDWDDELESFESGWPGFFEVLRIYLTDFSGQPAASMQAMVTRTEDISQAWSTLTTALGLASRDVGDRCRTTGDAPRWSGVVARVHQDVRSRELMLRLDEPCPGVSVIGACGSDETARVMVSNYFYGPAASATAVAQQAAWTDWLRAFAT